MMPSGESISRCCCYCTRSPFGSILPLTQVQLTLVTAFHHITRSVIIEQILLYSKYVPYVSELQAILKLAIQ